MPIAFSCKFTVAVVQCVRSMPESRLVRARLARLLKALSHPTRIWVLEELARSGERCVCELAQMSGTDDSTMSRHLTQLRVAGLVVDERRGTQVYCRLAGPQVAALLQCALSIVGEDRVVAHHEWLGVC